MFIKNFFKKQSRFERKLFESLIFDNEETVDLEDVKQMLQGFPCLSEIDQLVQSMTIVQVCREFLRLIPQQLESHKKLKVYLQCMYSWEMCQTWQMIFLVIKLLQWLDTIYQR